MARRSKSDKKTVIVVDDHNLVRDAIVQMINSQKDLYVVAATGDGEELMGLINEHKPDLVLLDIELPTRSGLTVARDMFIRYPKQKLIFMTMHKHEEYALRGLRVGASGYVLKTSEGQELLEAIRAVIAGETYITRDISDRIARHVARNSGKQAYAQLSDREFQVLRGLAIGKSCKELSDEFDLSVKTIYTYRTRLLEKLDLKNDIDLLRYVLRHSLLTGEHDPLPLDA